MSDESSNIPTDLISVAEAARITHNAHRGTIRRWILQGKLQGYQVAGFRMLVSKADVEALIQPFAPPTRGTAGFQERGLPDTKRTRTKRQRDAERVLREHGILK